MNKGFTLIETIFYISLSTVLGVALIATLVSSLRVYTTAKEYRSVQQNGITLFERISKEVRDADTILVTPETLSLQKTGSTIQIYKEGTTVMLSENGSVVGPLVGDVIVQSLVFSSIGNEGVRMIATLQKGSVSRIWYNSSIQR